MENSQTGAQTVTRDDEEDVSKKQEEDEDVEEAQEVAGVEDDEHEDAVAKEILDPGCGGSK